MIKSSEWNDIIEQPASYFIEFYPSWNCSVCTNYVVIASDGPLKLGPGRKMPAATSLVVSTSNLSDKIETLAVGNSSCNFKAVVKPTTPAPITPKCIEKHSTESKVTQAIMNSWKQTKHKLTWLLKQYTQFIICNKQINKALLSSSQIMRTIICETVRCCMPVRPTTIMCALHRTHTY